MNIRFQSRRKAIFCSLIFLLCVSLFVTGVTGQQSNMDQQASEVNSNISKGWSLPSILQTVLAVLNIILTLPVLWIVWRIYKRKQQGDSRRMAEGCSLLAEGELQEKIDRFLEENERLQREKRQFQEERDRFLEENERLQREKREKEEEKGQLQEKIDRFLEENERLQREKRQLQDKMEFLQTQQHKEDVILDPDTAHPRLELSDDGKSVKDTGAIRKVPSKEKRFDSHTFVLAKEGYTSGRHYWEVDVGKRSSWALGIARESVTRKGTLTLSPKNGFWVMGFAHGREYWAYTEPWTRLIVGGKLPKIGIFLDISAKKLSFYNVHNKAALYTFTMGGDSSQKEKLFPFFSTGPASAKPDEEPLRVVWVFDDDDDDDE